MTAPLTGDPHDRALVAHTHPADWALVKPDGRYNLVVIGGGPAGLVAAMGAAGLGARVALVERDLLGGDCLVAGCVPSKALLRAAHAAHEARSAGAFGVHAEVRVDFAGVMERLRAVRAGIAPHDAAARLRDAGVDVFFGVGRFADPETVVVGDTRLRFARALIATGARAVVPSFPGAEHGLTNETLFSLRDLPRRLVVVGAGPIGAEMAQAFRRLGGEVTVVDVADRLLPREDPDASEVIRRVFTREGIALRLGARVARIRRTGEERVVEVEAGEALPCDAVLLAVGRAANVDGLGLLEAGVRFGARVEVDAFLRTSNPRIYAAGDVASPFQFTHAADAMARIVLRNALFGGRQRHTDLVIPWATYTSPEVAHVGLGHAEAASRPDVVTSTADLGGNDRGAIDGDEGFARVHADRRTGRILGATIVGSDAGDLVNTVSLAITAGLGLGDLARTVHAYPTSSELLKKLGDGHQRARLTPRVASVLRAWLRWRR